MCVLLHLCFGSGTGSNYGHGLDVGGALLRICTRPYSILLIPIVCYALPFAIAKVSDDRVHVIVTLAPVTLPVTRS
jgi:hypothetical protein